MVRSYDTNPLDQALVFSNPTVVSLADEPDDHQRFDVPRYCREKVWCEKCRATVYAPCVVCALGKGSRNPQPLLGYNITTKRGQKRLKDYTRVSKMIARGVPYPTIAKRVKLTYAQVEEFAKLYMT
jgi:hypothetical protein